MSAANWSDVRRGVLRGCWEAIVVVAACAFVAGLIPLLTAVALAPGDVTTLAAVTYTFFALVFVFLGFKRRSALTVPQEHYKWKAMGALGLGIATVTGSLAIAYGCLIWQTVSTPAPSTPEFGRALSHQSAALLFGLLVSFNCAGWLLREEKFAKAHAAK